MIEPKNCIDKTMRYIIKHIKLPKFIKDHISYELQLINNKLCYCILSDNVTMSTITMDHFYKHSVKVLVERVNIDIEQYVTKVYAKTSLVDK